VELNLWLSSNRLSLKTKCMFIGTRQKTSLLPVKPNISLDGHQIDRGEINKCLGVQGLWSPLALYAFLRSIVPTLHFRSTFTRFITTVTTDSLARVQNPAVDLFVLVNVLSNANGIQPSGWATGDLYEKQGAAVLFLEWGDCGCYSLVYFSP